jgi:hypothetical protein
LVAGENLARTFTTVQKSVKNKDALTIVSASLVHNQLDIVVKNYAVTGAPSIARSYIQSQYDARSANALRIPFASSRRD